MTANIYYDDIKKKFIVYYQGKKYERADKAQALELVGSFMSDMRLEKLYA